MSRRTDADADASLTSQRDLENIFFFLLSCSFLLSTNPANWKVALGAAHFHKPRSTAAKKTAEAAVQHEQEVNIIQFSPFVTKLPHRRCRWDLRVIDIPQKAGNGTKWYKNGEHNKKKQPPHNSRRAPDIAGPPRSSLRTEDLSVSPCRKAYVATWQMTDG